MTRQIYRHIIAYTALQAFSTKCFITATSFQHKKFSNKDVDIGSRILDTQCIGNTAGSYPCEDINLEAFIASSTFTASATKQLSE